MAENKDEIAAERYRLREENDRLLAEVDSLKGQLTTAGGGRVAAPQHTFQLSEGDRQALAIHGQINVGGRMRTREEIAGMLQADGNRGDQGAVDLGDAEPPAPVRDIDRPGVPGVDFVYPSVAPGEIDPAVAGTPGISGPSANTSQR
jgi:hypothetical protein